MVLPPALAQLLQGTHLNFSPKVAVPGFVGLAALSACCELDRYHYHVDFFSAAFAIVNAMLFLGWLVRDPARDAGQLK